MPRKCTACIHPQATEINKLLIANRSYRVIAGQFGLAYASLQRHASNCIADALDAAREAQVIETAIVTEAKAIEWTAQIDKLMRLADGWLSDPTNPANYTLAPRAEQVPIIFLDPKDLDESGKPLRKTVDLQSLLDQLAAGGLNIVSVKLPKVDYVGLLLEAAKAGAQFIDRLAKLRGEYTKAKPNPLTIEEQIAVLMREHKMDRGAALKQLKEWFGEEEYESVEGVH